MEDFVVDEDFLTVRLVDGFAEHFGVSRSSVRRDIDHGGLRIDGAKYPYYTCAYQDVRGRVVQLGKRRFLRFVLDTTADAE